MISLSLQKSLGTNALLLTVLIPVFDRSVAELVQGPPVSVHVLNRFHSDQGKVPGSPILVLARPCSDEKGKAIICESFIKCKKLGKEAAEILKLVQKGSAKTRAIHYGDAADTDSYHHPPEQESHREL